MRLDHYQVTNTTNSCQSIVIAFLFDLLPFSFFLHCLLASSFPFEEAQLVQFECHLLHILRFDIVPQMAPSMLVRQMFSLWLEPLPMGMTSMVIMKLTDTLINQFWKQSSADSLRFAPSTIAISALLLAFSKCKIDCGAWLQRLPDGMFPPKSSSSLTPHRIFAIHEQSFLDIDACLLAMMGEERTYCLSSQQQRGTSHTHTKQQDTFCHTPTLTSLVGDDAMLVLRRVNTPTTVITSFPDNIFPDNV